MLCAVLQRQHQCAALLPQKQNAGYNAGVFFFHMFTTDSAPAVNAELSGYGGATGPSLGPGCDCLGVGIALEERVW